MKVSPYRVNDEIICLIASFEENLAVLCDEIKEVLNIEC